MKESIHYWTVACLKPEALQDKRANRLSERRYISAHGEVRDYSAHCMIEDRQAALDFANTLRPELVESGRGAQQLIVEPVHILISYSEKGRFLRRINEQTRVVQGFVTRRALAML